MNSRKPPQAHLQQICYSSSYFSQVRQEQKNTKKRLYYSRFHCRPVPSTPAHIHVFSYPIFLPGPSQYIKDITYPGSHTWLPPPLIQPVLVSHSFRALDIGAASLVKFPLYYLHTRTVELCTKPIRRILYTVELSCLALCPYRPLWRAVIKTDQQKIFDTKFSKYRQPNKKYYISIFSRYCTLKKRKIDICWIIFQYCWKSIYPFSSKKAANSSVLRSGVLTYSRWLGRAQPI